MEKKDIQNRAKEVFDSMMAYDIIAELPVPQTVIEALDYAANYFGDIAMGREPTFEKPEDAFPSLFLDHKNHTKTIMEQMLEEVKGMKIQEKGTIEMDFGFNGKSLIEVDSNRAVFYNQALKDVEQAIIKKFGE